MQGSAQNQLTKTSIYIVKRSHFPTNNQGQSYKIDVFLLNACSLPTQKEIWC